MGWLQDLAELEQPDLMPIAESRAPCPACGLPFGQCQYRYMSCYAPVDATPPKGIEYLIELGLVKET